MAPLRGLYDKSDNKLRLTARGRALGVLAVLLLVGATFSFFNVPLVSSAANSVNVAHIDMAVPTDPQSTLWERTQEADIPMTSQQIYQPGGGSTRVVKVRALEDGQTIAFHVSWDDDTRNDTIGTVPSDSAAIQLPTDPTNLPYQCMGQSSNRVNIWQWKAALEREGLTNQGAMPLENAGIRNLASNGICRAVDSPGEEPHVKSYHDGKRWQLVFYRALSKGGAGTAPLTPGLNSSIAFAVWNGALGEARGMKAVTTWNALLFTLPPTDNTGNLITLGAVLLLSAAAVGYAMRRVAA